MGCSSLGSGGQKHWISCSEMRHFEIMTITQLSFPLWRAKTSHGPYERLFPTGPSPGCFSASNHLPPKASQRQIFKDLEKGQAEEQPTSHQPRSQETRACWCLRNTTRRYTDSSCSLSTHQGTCMATSSANTFLLARVPKPLHSQFLFLGRACGFFFSFPPPSFLARGQPSAQNRLQDR